MDLLFRWVSVRWLGVGSLMFLGVLLIRWLKARLFRFLGLRALRYHRPDSALASFQRAAEQEPENVHTMLLIAICLNKLVS